MHTVNPADYHDLVQVADPQLSPDCERVAFVRKAPKDDESYEATIYVVPLGGDEPTQFTVSEGVDSQPRWSPDGSHLAFVSTRGADDDRPQLWLLPTDGGEARQVTSVVGGVSGLEWSPDGSRVLFTQASTADDRAEGRDFAVEPDYEPETPDPRVIDRLVYRAHQRYADGRRNHVYTLDVESALEQGAVTAGDNDALERLTDGDVDHTGATWGDDETVYYARKLGEEPDDSIESEILAHDLETGEVEQVTETIGWATMLAATTDGRVAYPWVPKDGFTLRQTELKVYDRTAGRETTVTDSIDRTLSFDGGIEWGPNEESLYFATPDEGASALWSAPGDGSEAPTTVYGEGVTLEGFSVGDDAIAYVQSEWDHPGDVFASTRGGNEVTRLTRVNADYLENRAVAQPEELRYESDQGPVQGWLLTPPDFDPDETYPLVVEIHGGPHARWTTSGTMWHEFQSLAAAGYVVFWSNPRGSTGYGEAHAAAIERDWGDVTLTDVLAGVDLACEREYVDADEQYVTGGSFGGFMTAWTVGRTDRFRAAVSQRGVYDFTSFYGSTDAFKLVEGDYGVTPWEDPEHLWEHSPVAHVPNVTTPTLLIHADQDYRTPANTAELFYLGLKKHGVDTRMVRYPREGHELSRSGEPAHVVDRLERIVRWFDGYSDYTDAPPALERDPNEALTGVQEGDASEGESDTTENGGDSNEGEDENGGDDAPAKNNEETST
ncbi:S9 family peptidase [Natronosalvus halobius]|uniref:S9 family peptidase n=1 Tax=Natronosalvus halobius TaxID=2953746 RepID=UPI00209E7D78|nr:S9 family peptidase [Natronosalvus halobius]USZ71080.1 S9 family peptidase [Natronosalvus halobius]